MNTAIFKAQSSLPVAGVVNAAGGKAYDMGAKAGLAQFAATGTFNNTFYVTAEDQLKQSLDLAKQVDDLYLAKVAVYAKEQRYMKDMPAFLLAVLSTRNSQLTAQIFNRVITNGDMLRRFVQIIRSGAVGRKSLGTGPKKLVQNWLNNRDPKALVFDSIGNEPTLGDVVKLSHVKPTNERQAAMFSYLVGKKPVAVVEDERNEVNVFNLPQNLVEFEHFKAGNVAERLPHVPFQMLTGLPLTKDHWVGIARDASWDMTRRNLNTFQRHGVLDVPGMVDLISNRLASKEEVQKNKHVFPYNLLITYMEMQNNAAIPMKIRLALQDALEHATMNVPSLDGKKVVVAPDVSGSMRGASVTGARKGATSVARAIHVAALVSATMLRVNNDAMVVPFDQVVHNANALNPRDSVMTNAEKLAKYGGGGTNCALPLNFLNDNDIRADLVLYVSDNESWINDRKYTWYRGHEATGMVHAWKRFKQKNPRAKLVCIDTCPNSTVQAPDDKDILNVGGFSDSVFTTVANFVKGGGDHWVNEVEKTQI